MRKMEFKMERAELLDVVKKGEHFTVKESALPNSYYYTMEHAYGMSANYTTLERLKSREGVVVDVEETPKGYFVTMEFEE